MPTLDLKLDISRLQAEEHRAKKDKKRKEEEHQRLRARMQHTKRLKPQNSSQVIADDSMPRIVLQPLTGGTPTSAANRQQRPLSQQERVLFSQNKPVRRGSFTNLLADNAPLSKRPVSSPGATIKDNVAQLRLLLQKCFQNTAANKKLQQQKEAVLREAMQQERARAEEEERKLRSRRF